MTMKFDEIGTRVLKSGLDFFTVKEAIPEWEIIVWNKLYLNHLLYIFKFSYLFEIIITIFVSWLKIYNHGMYY